MNKAVFGGMRCGIFAALAAGAMCGCSSIKNSELKADALALPAEKRSHVYAIFLNSMNDPLGMTNFKSVYNFTVDCGFKNSRYHHFNGGTELAREVREILKKDKEAKICLIGWSGASLYAFDAAGLVAKDGITIDLIVYLDSDWIKEQRLSKAAHPTNVARTALLYSENRTAPTQVPNPVFYRIPVENHSDAASAPRTGEIIVRELMMLAERGAANR